MIDGASTDNTLEQIKKHGEYPIKIVSEPDKGIYDAMNKGLRIASGEIVGFLNADDFYNDATVLEQIDKVFESPDVQCCYADLVYVKKDDVNCIVRYWKSSPFIKEAFLVGWCPAHPTFYVRRSVYERYGQFDLVYRLAADADLMIRFLEKCQISNVYVNRVWVKMRLGGQTNLGFGNIVRQNREILTSLRRHGFSTSTARFVFTKLLSRIRQRWSGIYAK